MYYNNRKDAEVYSELNYSSKNEWEIWAKVKYEKTHLEE